MTSAWTDSRVVDTLDAEEARLERLRDDVESGRTRVSLLRAQRELDRVREGASGTAEMIERAALRDDVRTLAEAQVLIREQRGQIQRLEGEIEALRAERHIDALTGCLDRGGFDETLGREWNRAMRGRNSVGLVFVDVDAFKDVNDRFGHQVGDEALRAIAHAIVGEAKRSGDAVGRYGGDEFVVVIPGADLPGALAFGERVRASVSTLRLRVDGAAVPLSVSVGAASATPSMRVKREELVRRADRAVYRAKEAGRNRAVAVAVEEGLDVFYAPEPPTAAQDATRAQQSRSSPRRR